MGPKLRHPALPRASHSCDTAHIGRAGDSASLMSRTVLALISRGANSTKLSKAECVYARKGLALPRASHSGEIALVGSRRLRSTLAAAPALFVVTIITVAKTSGFISRFHNGVPLDT